MEILDTGGEPERDPEPPRRASGDLDVDLGDPTAAPDDDLLEEPGVTPSAARAALATLTDAGSLALAAILIEVVTMSGGYQIVLMARVGLQAEQTQTDTLKEVAVSVAICAAVSLALALAALFRLRADAPGWARAAAGSAVIIGLLLLAIAGYMAWEIAGAPPSTGSTVFGTGG